MEALEYAQKNELAFFMLGGGSNVIFSDKGFDGLTIKIQEVRSKNQESIRLIGETVECWAGENLSSIVNLAKNNSLTGMEWATGIPGTVGGAVRGNAGAPFGCIADNIEKAKVLDISEKKSRICEYENAECNFSYRNSIFKQNKKLIILSATLKLQKGERAMIEKKIQEISKIRAEQQPKGFSSGSFFKNPTVNDSALIDKFEKDTGVKVSENKKLYRQNGEGVTIPAGWLIEKAGFKGKKIGGVMVSEKHANFFLNDGTGSAEDVVILAGVIKEKIRDKFNVQLREEVAYVGF